MESKNIKDYLHLYLGCEVSVPITHQRKFIISGVQGGWTGTKIPIVSVEDKDKTWTFDCTEIKLILRPLSDMTEGEDQIEFPKNNRGEFIDMHWYPEGYIWLLSKGFDLFGLIDAGLAIEKSQ